MLDCQRSLFHIPEDIAYLNCAYLSPQMKAVEAAARHAQDRKNSPWTMSVNDFFEPVQRLKAAFSSLINCPEPGRIALIPAVSYGMANVTRNIGLTPGQKVVMVEEQFPSNYYSWERLCREQNGRLEIVEAPVTSARSSDWNAAILKSIDEHTAAVALGHVHWADGSLYDLVAIREACDRVGAYLIIDGTQSVGALPFDVEKIRPDALICAGYKWLMGPYSLGVAYYGPRFDEGIPIEENWINRYHSEDFAGLVNYESRYQPFAGRYSVGQQSNFFLVPQLETAIRQILAWRPERIQEYTREIAQTAVQELVELGMQVDQSADRAHHLFGIRLPAGIDLDRLKAAFAANQVYVSQRGNAIRVAPHVYNTREDFEKLVACFREAV